MNSSNFKGRKIQNPSISINRDVYNDYGSSLNALNDVWSAIQSTKKDLSDVQSRIKKSQKLEPRRDLKNLLATKHKTHIENGVHNKSKDCRNTERKIVYEDEPENIYHKENIPPPSSPKPVFQNYISPRKDTEFIPTRKILYKVEREGTKDNYFPNFGKAEGVSILGKAALSKQSKSEALAKLKERINQQKINVSNLSNNQDDQLDLFPEKLQHTEADPVAVANDDMMFQPPIKRKIAQAPSAPSYKGFNQVDTTYTKAQEKHMIRKQRQLDEPNLKNRGKSVSKLSPKTHRKGKQTATKSQRIVAPKKSPQLITTSSWRVGEELKKKIYVEMRKANNKKKVKEKESGDQNQAAALSDSPYLKSDENKEEESASIKSNDRGSISNLKEQSIDEAVAELSTDETKNNTNTENQEELDPMDDNTLMDNLSKSAVLTETAKTILKDMRKPIEEVSEKESINRKKEITAIVDTGLSKRRLAKKSPVVKRKLEEEHYPKQKVRHYDQVEVQKYMEKQIAVRKKKEKEKQILEKEKKREKEKRLQELYNKQKSALKESLEAKKKNIGREAFIMELLSEKKQTGFKEGQIQNASAIQERVERFKQNIEVFSTDISQEEHSSCRQDASKIQATGNQTSKNEVFKDSLDETLNGIANQPAGGYSSDPSGHPRTESTAASMPPATSLLTQPNIFSHTEVVGSRGNAALPDTLNKTKLERVAAIRSTAEALRERLDKEAKRISNLIKSSKTDAAEKYETSAIPVERIPSPQEDYPGISNIDEQVDFNRRLETMENAAKKIQSLYQRHVVRQSYDWSLPSGRSLYQTMEEARRRAFLNDMKGEPPVQLASSNYPSVLSQLYQKKEPVIDNFEEEYYSKDNSSVDDTLKEKDLALKPSSVWKESTDKSLESSSIQNQSSTHLLVNNALENSNALLEEKSLSSWKSSSDLPTEKRKEPIECFPSYSEDSDHVVLRKAETHVKGRETLRSILKKHKDTPPDKYSVINIFTQRYPALRKQQLTSQELSFSKTTTSNESDTEKLIADAYAHEMKSHLEEGGTSFDDLTEQSLKDETDRTIHNTSAHQSIVQPSSIQHSYQDKSLVLEVDLEHHSTSNSKPSEAMHSVAAQQRNLLSPKPLRRGSNSESDISEKLFSPRSHTPELPLKPIRSRSAAFHASKTSEDESSTIISPSQESTLSEIGKDELNPVLSSTKRSPPITKPDLKTHTPLTHQVIYTRGQRMSPNALERRLRAEINLFDNMGESLQQLNEMERVRHIVQAQQESVTLAQIVKSRQTSHQQEVEKLTLQAKEKAIMTAKELEDARAATAEANANALKSIADVRIKASTELNESTQMLAKVQADASTMTLDALHRIDHARQQATDAYKLAAERQIVDVEKIATAAAAAASSKAVEVALQQHKLQLEELRQKALKKITSSTTYEESGQTNSYTEESSSVIGASSKEKSDTASRSKISKSSKISFVDREKKKNVTIEERFSKSNSLNESISEIISKKSRNDAGSSTEIGPTGTQATSSIETEQRSSPISISGTGNADTSTKTLTPVSLPAEGSYISDKASIAEDLSRRVNERDKELSEALFSVKTQNSGSDALTVDGNQSNALSVDDKFHSSFTEDELKHDYRMVLPSENHRRKSLDHFSSTANETSSDELVLTPRNVNKLTKKRKPPFVEEDTFQKFTSGLVRQYIEEEEVRAQHQAALLALREKAIIDKTKAEMTFLEVKRKALKEKGRDEKMPPIAKKQRALVKKLQAEQNEIRRLKDAYKAASQERKSMLNQQLEIQRIRESTQKIWNKVETFDPACTTRRQSLEENANDEVNQSETFQSTSYQSLDVPSKRNLLSSTTKDSEQVIEEIISTGTHKTAPEIESETIQQTNTKDSPSAVTAEVPSEVKSETQESESGTTKRETETATKSRRPYTDDFDSASQLEKSGSSTLSVDLKKLQYMASKKYLTDREKKLQSRQKKFNEILDQENNLKSWKQKILEEERKLKLEIKKALKVKDLNVSESEISHQESDSEKTITESPQIHISKSVSERKLNSQNNFDSDGDHSISENVASSTNNESVDNSIDESINSHTKGQSKSETFENIETSPYSSDSSRNSKKDFSQKSSTENMKSRRAESPSNLKRTESVSVKSIKNKNNDKNTKKSFNYSDDSFNVSGKTQIKRDLSESRRNDEDSLTEGTSDASDIEQRLRGLENELNRRKNDLHKLRKHKQKEQLRRKEQALRNELLAIEQQINKENKELVCPQSPESSAHIRIQQPRVLSPRSSLESIRLPEKIKIPLEKESRKSLDFSSKYIEENSKSEKSEKADKIDVNSTLLPCPDEILKTSSINEEISVSKKHSLPDDRSKEKNASFHEEVGDTVTEVISSKSDRSISSVAEEKQDSQKLSSISHRFVDKPSKTLLEEFSETLTRPDNEQTISIKEDIPDIYDDDFFESNTTKSKPNDQIICSGTSKEPTYTDDFDASSQRNFKDSKSRKSSGPHDSITDVAKSEESQKSDSTFEEENQTISDKVNYNRSLSEQLSRKDIEIIDDFPSKADGTEGQSTSRSRSAREEQSLSQKSSQSDFSGAALLSKQSHSDIHISLKYSEHARQEGECVKSKKSEFSESDSTPGVVEQYEFSKSNLSSAYNYHTNDRVTVENKMTGTIRFLGKTSFSPVLVAGIELDEPLGTNNGSFHGKQYFSCGDDFGLFTTIDRLEKIGLEKESLGKSETSTIAEVSEDALSHHVSTEKEHSDHDSFVKNSSNSSTESKESDESSRPDNNSKHLQIELDRNKLDLDLNLKSSSDVESMDDDIPSPEKPDLNPVAEQITMGILKSLLEESLEFSTLGKELSAEKKDSTEYADDTKSFSEKEKEIEKEDAIDSASVNPDTTVANLLHDAIGHMLSVRKEKEMKLSTENKAISRLDFMSLLIDHKTVVDSPPSGKEASLDNELLAKKLQSVHDELSDLLDNDGDDIEVNNDNKVLILPATDDEPTTSKQQIAEELPFQIPYNEDQTRHLVYLAYDEISKTVGSISLQEIEASEEYLKFDNDLHNNLDENNTGLFKRLLFNLTKSLFYDIKEFRELQKLPRPKWMTTNKRTFSKFTRKTHVLQGENIRGAISEYINICLDLKPGRPSLEQLKKKLPLNPAKKDYVDAILVEEIREEETQWVSYDDDELKVKYQLADSILDSLLDEIVSILNGVS